MRKYIFLLWAILLFGCKNSQKKNSYFTENEISSLKLSNTKILNVEADSATIIDLSPILKDQSYDFGLLVKEVKLIPLETTDKSLLDAIYKVVISDSNVYIYDKFKGGGIAIFNNKGKFVKRIPNGKGPGELLRLYDIDFDRSKNELIAYQHSYLLFYKPSGEFIRQEKLPFVTYNFTVIPGGYAFKTLDRQGNDHLGSIKDFTLLITNNHFNLKSVGLPVSPDKIYYGGYSYLHNNNNKLYITLTYTDTIYQYEKESNKLKASYILDYNKKKLPEQYLKGTREEFDNATTQNDYYFYLGYYLDNESHQVFLLKNSYLGFETIIYRDKNTGNIKGGTRSIFSMNEIPDLEYPKAVSNNYFISWYYPSKKDTLLFRSSIISEEDKLNIKGLAEYDNPVLVFFKLKNY